MKAPPDIAPASLTTRDLSVHDAAVSPTRPTRRLAELQYAAAVTLGFAIVSGILTARHAMWRDELQAWMIARDATGLVSLFRNLRYEGHPGLWHLCLFVLSRVTRAPAAMQVFHVAIATAAAFLFARYAPFPRLLRAGFVLGCFPLYQYAVIARCYALGWLLIVAFCIVHARPAKRAVPLAVLLFLLANTSAYGWMLALCLGLGLAPEFVARVRRGPLPHRLLFACGALVAAGLAVSLAQMISPSDSSFRAAAIAPIGRRTDAPTQQVWSTIDVIGSTYLPLGEVLGAPVSGITSAFILVPLFALALGRRPTALVAYVGSLVAMLLFKVLVYRGGPWHDGHFLLALVACLWLARNRAVADAGERRPGLARRALSWAAHGALWVIVVAHLVFAGRAVARDWHTPYSAATLTAQFIRARGLDGLPMLGDADYAASTVSGYLDRPMYYPSMKRWGTFIVWNGSREERLPEAEVADQSRALGRAYGQDVLLVLNHEAATDKRGWRDTTLLYASPSPTWTDERYWIYRLPYAPAVTTP